LQRKGELDRPSDVVCCMLQRKGELDRPSDVVCCMLQRKGELDRPSDVVCCKLQRKGELNGTPHLLRSAGGAVCGRHTHTALEPHGVAGPALEDAYLKAEPAQWQDPQRIPLQRGPFAGETLESLATHSDAIAGPPFKAQALGYSGYSG
jgi:hypothetical protein